MFFKHSPLLLFVTSMNFIGHIFAGMLDVLFLYKNLAKYYSPFFQLTRNQSLSPDTVTVSSAGGSGLHCDHKDYDILASEVFIVDWQTRHNPRRVFRRDMDKFYYGTYSVNSGRRSRKVH